MTFLGQVSIGWADGLIIYGPLGVGWIGMAYFINALMKLHKTREDAMEVREGKRDNLIRETMHEQAEAYQKVAHKLGTCIAAWFIWPPLTARNRLRRWPKVSWRGWIRTGVRCLSSPVT